MKPKPLALLLLIVAACALSFYLGRRSNPPRLYARVSVWAGEGAEGRVTNEVEFPLSFEDFCRAGHEEKR